MNLSDPIRYMRKPRVLLTMPNFGSMNPDVAHSWYDPEWAANPRKVEIVARREVRMSSIVGSFNNLWIEAINLRNEGKCDYFAMQHNDIEPESWWVDTLLAEMQARSAALISVVSPIKSHDRKLTTNARGREDDIWHRELVTVEEMRSFPVTFAPYQVCKPGEVMLINTALWLADIRSPAWDDFIFKQYARFVKGEDGRLQCELMPEDWELAHYCYSRNIPYLVTSKVKLRHFGLEYWPNYPESDS